MRALVLDTDATDKVVKVIDYARSHIYYPGLTEVIPGENPHLTVLLNTYRCVFSYTYDNGKLYRHLSVSVPVEGRYPNTYAVEAIAALFQFSHAERGLEANMASRNWMVMPNTKENCIVLAQELHD